MQNVTSICVFCGSREGTDPAYRAAAIRFGRMLAERNIRLVYGSGGIGLMGVLANAVLEAGGEVVGVIPEFLVRLEVGHVPGVRQIVVDSMHQRKAKMFELAEAFVVLPGGLGTLDETMEITTWKQLRQHDKPIVIFDVNDFWRPMLALLDRVIDGGFAHHKVQDLWMRATTAEEVFEAIAAAPQPDDEILSSHLERL